MTASSGTLMVPTTQTRSRLVRRRWGAAFALAAFALAAPLPAQDAPVAGQPAGATAELLAVAVGQATRRDPIVAVGRALHCDAGSPALDSASVHACAVLPTPDAERLVAAFARALGRPLLDRWPLTSADYPACEGEAVARISAPVVGDREGRWEGRITVELSCRQPTARMTQPLRVLAKEFLFQWDGRAWRLYQVGARQVAG